MYIINSILACIIIFFVILTPLYIFRNVNVLYKIIFSACFYFSYLAIIFVIRDIFHFKDGFMEYVNGSLFISYPFLVLVYIALIVVFGVKMIFKRRSN